MLVISRIKKTLCLSSGREPVLAGDRWECGAKEAGARERGVAGARSPHFCLGQSAQKIVVRLNDVLNTLKKEAAPCGEVIGSSARKSESDLSASYRQK